MSNINPIGIDLTSGQVRPLSTNDILTNSGGTTAGAQGVTGLALGATGIQGVTGIFASQEALSTLVSRVAVQNIAPAVYTAISFDTVETNDGFFNVGAPTRLTATVAGTYVISCAISYAPGSAGIRAAYIRKNGSATEADAYGVQRIPALTTGDPTGNAISATLTLIANDYVELIGYHGVGGGLDLTAKAQIVLVAGPVGSTGIRGVTGLALGATGIQGQTGIAGNASASAEYTLSSNQSIPNSTYTTILWNNSVELNGLSYNGVTGEFTVTYPGWYEISSAIVWGFAGAATARLNAIVINGTLVQQDAQLNNTSFQHSQLATFLYEFAASDTFKIQGWQGSGGLLNAETGSRISVILAAVNGIQGATGIRGLTGIQGFTGLALGATGIQGNTGIVVAAADYIHAILTSSQSIPNNTPTDVVWSSTSESNGITRSGASFTINRDGVYRVTVSPVFDTNGSGFRAVYLRDGSDNYLRQDSRSGVSSTTTTLAATWEIRRVTSDVVKITAQQGSGGALNLLGSAVETTAGQSHVWIEWVRA